MVSVQLAISDRRGPRRRPPGRPDAPGRERRRAALVAQDQRRGRRPARERAVRLGAMGERALERRPDVGDLARNLREPELHERLVGDADVAVAEAVGDHRAAPDDRLEHGQPGARVNERVARGEHVAHPVGEAHHPQARLGAELLRHARAQLVVAPAQAQHDRRPAPSARLESRRAGRRRPSRRPTPRSPWCRRPAAQAPDAHRRATAPRGTPARSAAWPSARCRGRRSPRPPRSSPDG